MDHSASRMPLEIPVWIYSCFIFQRNFWLLDSSPLEFAIIILKPRPNDRNKTGNIVGQHVLCFSVGHSVATCCDMLGVIGSSLRTVNSFMHPLWILHDVLLVGSGLCNNVASTRRNRPNARTIVAICCV